MSINNPSLQIDEYIEKSADFAKPICKKLRKLIHQAEPEIVEAIKWGCPAFVYKKKTMFLVWAFKSHASVIFYEGALMKDEKKLFNYGENNLKGRQIQFTDVSQISEKDLKAYFEESIKLFDEGKRIKIPVSKDKTVKIPYYIMNALKENELVEKYEEQIYTYRKGYVQWIEQAKQDETKKRRLEQMIREVKLGKFYMNMPR